MRRQTRTRERDGGMRAGERVHAPKRSGTERRACKSPNACAQRSGVHSARERPSEAVLGRACDGEAACAGTCAGLMADEAISMHARDLYLEDRNHQATHRAHLSHRRPRFASCFCEARPPNPCMYTRCRDLPSRFSVCVCFQQSLIINSVRRDPPPSGIGGPCNLTPRPKQPTKW